MNTTHMIDPAYLLPASRRLHAALRSQASGASIPAASIARLRLWAADPRQYQLLAVIDGDAMVEVLLNTPLPIQAHTLIPRLVEAFADFEGAPQALPVGVTPFSPRADLIEYKDYAVRIDPEAGVMELWRTISANN
mgnify:CR=1 FL=1